MCIKTITILGITLIIALGYASFAHAQPMMYNDQALKWCNTGKYKCVRNAYGEVKIVSRNNNYGQRKTGYQARKTRVNSEPVRRAHVSPPEKISGGNIVNVDLGNLSWGAYDGDGNLVRSGRVSGGKSYCPDIGRSCRTVTGTYTIYSKRGPECKSTRFPVGKGGAPMPYCMFFKGGYAMHGSNAVPNYNASHGCVRMSPSDAQWLNQQFVRVGSTRVNVHY